MRARASRIGYSLALVGVLALPVAACAPNTKAQRPVVAPLANADGWNSRFVAGSTPVTDQTGRTWAPDAGVATGGDVHTSSQTISGTATPDLYRHERIGVEGYSIPLPASGTYEVDLLMTETGGTSAGSRVFDISAENRPAESGVDIAKRSGFAVAHHEVLVVPVQGTTLDLGFTASRGKAEVSAVSVAFVAPGTGSDRPVFTDDFDGRAGTKPDAGSWTHETGGNGWGNDELQTYTSSAANSALDGKGSLAITARRQTRTGEDGIKRGFTSARLNTKGKVEFRYGTISTRMQVPAGKGLLPAFWTLGADVDEVGWPASGEIDVAEVLGDSTTEVHGTLHGPAGGGDYNRGTSRATPSSLADGFHTYSATWLPNTVSFFVDGQRYAVQSRADLAADERWPFNKPHYLLLDLAVGGVWPGSPDPSTTFPARLLVDQVRVSQW